MALDVYSELDMLTVPTRMDIDVESVLNLLFMVSTALVYIARSAF